LGTKHPRGVLLAGPSGTGKSLMAQAVAVEAGAFFYWFNEPQLVTEKDLRTAFQDAKKNSPAVILIDQLDTFIPCPQKVRLIQS
jgi:transitional endoplasmic reticulum ATPase